MEKKYLEVVTSHVFDFIDIPSIYEYGYKTFGINAADFFVNDIYASLKDLSTEYLIHSECQHLVTKTKKYRNIILGAYLIIYRITPTRIEVLRTFHSSRSPRTIKKTRQLKIT